MKLNTTSLTLGFIALTSVSLAACQRTPAPEAPSAEPAPVAEATVPAPLPASEYLETLTEQAFSATPDELDALISQVRTAVVRDRGSLSSAAATELDQRLQQITDDRAALKRADLAIASVEAFRLFVSAAPDTPPAAGVVPAEVSLLDYAGFRYQADLKAEPVRWDDAAAAADYAAGQWDRISARVTNEGLRTRFGNTVAEMKLAIKDRNATHAALVVTRELDLVDELEAHFSGH
ncbi:hypothetical protein [uncultured Brevundimonas sp.]|uniref:hypothetical protein n=1 Tax=uncultured Brevundimonas sp. TaxID=213418 RepID=UPI0030EDC355|tara:strand:- start:6490 stop:7194 length:705 start_codon:yes stop_codon:yes gene_type:complete